MRDFLKIGVQVLSVAVSLQCFFVAWQHVSCYYIQLSVIVKISNIIPHAIAAIMPEMICATFRKCSVMIVDVVIIIFMKIIADIYIFPSIIVQVCNTNSQSITYTAL